MSNIIDINEFLNIEDSLSTTVNLMSKLILKQVELLREIVNKLMEIEEKINEKRSFMMRNKDVAFSKEDSHTNYDEDRIKAERARNNQLRDTDPRTLSMGWEGYLAVDDLDRMRRLHLKHITK